ncbi:unnamed protein product [Pleuronectes platessa]|uniref:Uncharacterized protein n=1 Tax=Pleuronectes platessa TaxID=8262 RepID=A0A9N7Z375_PLEPL|nr:unnamed protein product [Pleuronectes platessa]
MAQHITGNRLPAIQDIYDQLCLRLAGGTGAPCTTRVPNSFSPLARISRTVLPISFTLGWDINVDAHCRHQNASRFSSSESQRALNKPDRQSQTRLPLIQLTASPARSQPAISLSPACHSYPPSPESLCFITRRSRAYVAAPWIAVCGSCTGGRGGGPSVAASVSCGLIVVVVADPVSRWHRVRALDRLVVGGGGRILSDYQTSSAPALLKGKLFSCLNVATSSFLGVVLHCLPLLGLPKEYFKAPSDQAQAVGVFTSHTCELSS